MFEELKEKYYSKDSLSDKELNKLNKEFNLLYDREKQIEYHKDKENSKPVAFYDIEHKINFIIYLLNDNDFEKNIKLISNSNDEYYEFYHFYDEVTGIDSADLIKKCIIDNNIPVTEFINLNDVRDIMCNACYEYDRGQNY